MNFGEKSVGLRIGKEFFFHVERSDLEYMRKMARQMVSVDFLDTYS
jgi:hypothetical protein